MQKLQTCTDMEITFSAWMTVENYHYDWTMTIADTIEQYMSITFDTRDYGAASQWDNSDFEFFYDSAYCYADRCTLRVAIDADFSAGGHRINNSSTALFDGYIADSDEYIKRELQFHNLKLS